MILDTVKSTPFSSNHTHLHADVNVSMHPPLGTVLAIMIIHNMINRSSRDTLHMINRSSRNTLLTTVTLLIIFYKKIITTVIHSSYSLERSTLLSRNTLLVAGVV